MPVFARALAAFLAVLLVTACSPAATQPAAPPTAPPPAAAPAAAQPAVTPPPAAATAASKPAAAPVSGEVVVFAAASLTDVFQDMATAFQQANPNARLTFNFGASSTLATQLGQGASADVFASADPIQMDNARKSGAITGQDQVFAGNRLVLITPKDNPANITSVQDLANDGVKFVTAQPSVPIGTYTSQMLDKASSDPSYGSDFKDKVMANTVSQETDVRQVVSKVQLGEADAAIVYSTDPTPQVRDQLNIIQVPDALQTLATYPIAVAKGNNSSGGEAFVSYVLAPEGQATLARWGFLPPSPPQTSPSAQPTASTTGGQPPAAGGAALASAAAANAPIPSVASATFAPQVAVSGLVANPRAFSIMLAYLQDGKPMGDKQGMARLVVPGDKRGGRYVSTVKSIEIRDPGPAEP